MKIMKMNDFLQLVESSLLSEERKSFWIEKFQRDDISSDEFRSLLDEIDEAIKFEKENVKDLEDKIATEKEKLNKLEKEQLKQFSKAYPLILEKMDEVVDEFKKDASDIDEAVSGAIEHMKTSKDKKEIESIRKILGEG